MTSIQVYSGPRVGRDTFERSQVTGKRAKKLPPELKTVRRQIADVREARRAGRCADPLLVAASNRSWRFACRREEALREAEARETRAVRETLLTAARIARKAGFTVRSSRDRAGRISSYYLTREGGPAIRISDHQIPSNARRDFMAEAHGRMFHDGYHGPEIVIRARRSETWLRRALALAAAGRSVG